MCMWQGAECQLFPKDWLDVGCMGSSPLAAHTCDIINNGKCFLATVIFSLLHFTTDNIVQINPFCVKQLTLTGCLSAMAQKRVK